VVRELGEIVKYYLTIFWSITCLLLCGCASTHTSTNQFIVADQKVGVYDYAGAIIHLEASKEQCYKAKDRVLYYLDLGMLYHLKGDYQKSNELLTNAEVAIEELYTKSISRAAASLLLNDNVFDYSGEDYEDVYLNVIKTVNYLHMNDFDNAFVEVRRINNKLEVMDQKYNKLAEGYNTSSDAKIKFPPVKSQFNNSALGRYLSMLMYRAEGKLDDAHIDFNKIGEAWASQAQLYNFPMPRLGKHLTKTSKAKVNILSFIGAAPRLFSRTLTIHTFKDAIAIYYSDGKKEQQLNLFPWPDMTDGYHFKFALPYMEKHGTAVVSVGIEVNGSIMADLETIESLENAAVDTYASKEKMIYLKTIIRSVIKGVLNEKANQELDKSTGAGFWGTLTRAVSSAMVDASENADLRLSRYFPSRALVGELELDPGTYSLRLLYYGGSRQLLHIEDFGQQTVTTGKFNFFQSTLLK
jgi:hypothetical protein